MTNELPPLCTLSEKEIESLYVYGHRNPDNLRKLCDQALLALQLATKEESGLEDDKPTPMMEQSFEKIKEFCKRRESVTQVPATVPDARFTMTYTLTAEEMKRADDMQASAQMHDTKVSCPTPAVTDPTLRVHAFVRDEGYDPSESQWRNFAQTLERETIALQRQVAEQTSGWDQCRRLLRQHVADVGSLKEALVAAQPELARVREETIEDLITICEQHYNGELIAKAIRAKLKEGT